jgi:hypothetical protein
MPIAASSRTTRIVVSDYRHKKIPFDHENGTTFVGRYVWDFETGKVLASWFPESESYANIFNLEIKIREPFRFAISPDGRYVAQGGSGKLVLYKIEP